MHVGWGKKWGFRGGRGRVGFGSVGWVEGGNELEISLMEHVFPTSIWQIIFLIFKELVFLWPTKHEEIEKFLPHTSIYMIWIKITVNYLCSRSAPCVNIILLVWLCTHTSPFDVLYRKLAELYYFGCAFLSFEWYKDHYAVWIKGSVAIAVEIFRLMGDAASSNQIGWRKKLFGFCMMGIL